MAIERAGLEAISRVLTTLTKNARASELHAAAQHATDALAKALPALTRGRELSHLSRYRLDARNVHVLQGSAGTLTRAASAAQTLPLQFLISGNDKLELTLHPLRAPERHLTLDANALVVFASDAGYSVRVGHSAVLSGQLQVVGTQAQPRVVGTHGGIPAFEPGVKPTLPSRKGG